MCRVLGLRIIYKHILDRVRRANNLGGAHLPLWRPHCEPRQETATGVLELAQGITDIAATKSVS